MTHRDWLALGLVAVLLCTGCVSTVSQIAHELDRTATPGDTSSATTTAARDVTGCPDQTTAAQATSLAAAPPRDAANLTPDVALDLAAETELTYKQARIDTPERGDASLNFQGGDTNRTANGVLVRLDMLYGGTAVDTYMPPTTAAGGDADERTPITEVREFDDFYTVYYYVSSTRVVRHERARDAAPPASPSTGGELLFCRSLAG